MTPPTVPEAGPQPVEGSLDAFAAWMEAGNHDPVIREDYGDQVIECRAKGCLAGTYDWLSTHINDYTRADATSDEPDFGQCCGNYLDTGECCAAVNGTANLR